MTTVNSHPSTRTVAVISKQFSTDRQPVILIHDARYWRVIYSNGDIDARERGFSPMPQNILPSVDISNIPAAKCAELIMAYVDGDGKISNLDGFLMAWEYAGATVKRELLKQLAWEKQNAWLNYMEADRSQSASTQAEGFTSAQAQDAINQRNAARIAYQNAYAAWEAAAYPDGDVDLEMRDEEPAMDPNSIEDYPIDYSPMGGF